MFRRPDGICKCGHGDNIKEFRIQDYLWCCKTTSDNCTFNNDKNEVNCNGTALSLSEECHSNTYNLCNYYPTDEYRNGYDDAHDGYVHILHRSQLSICKDNR